MFLIPFSLLLFSFIFTFFFGNKCGVVIIYLNILTIFICLFTSFFILFNILINNSILIITLFNWIEISYIEINIGLLFDTLSAWMFMIVLFISFIVHIFSFNYMYNDPNYCKFFAFLNLFTFFMLILVVSPNFLQFFIGWEGIGISSYILINFWYNRAEANRSAFKAIILNRVGDVALYIYIVLHFIYFDTLDFILSESIISLLINEKIIITKNFYINLIDILAFCLMISAFAKSSQFGLHTWLPDAMEGPTPVSALLHAATMVTAGIYLLLRCTWVLEHSFLVLNLICFWTCITNFFISLINIFQVDMKKIIAYSTTGQLSYMFMAYGMSDYMLSFFHLLNHAFFKALLFLLSGIIIHYILNWQDIFVNKQFFNNKLIIYVNFIFAIISLIAIPFTSGFYSKDLILEFSLMEFNFSINYLIHWMGTLSVIFTTFYSFLLLNSLFWDEKFISLFSKKFRDYTYIREDIFIVPLLSLTILSLISGYLFDEIFNSFSNIYFNDVFFFNISNGITGTTHYTSGNDIILLLFGLWGCLLGFMFEIFYEKYLIIIFNKFFFLNVTLSKKYFWDLIVYFKLRLEKFGFFGVIDKFADKSLLELFYSSHLIIFFKETSRVLSFFQYGYIYIFFFFTLIFFYFIFFIFFFIILHSYLIFYIWIWIIIEYNWKKNV